MKSNNELVTLTYLPKRLNDEKDTEQATKTNYNTTQERDNKKWRQSKRDRENGENERAHKTIYQLKMLEPSMS